MDTRPLALALGGVLLGSAACGADAGTGAREQPPAPSVQVSPGPASATPTPVPTRQAPCDPGFGAPKDSEWCPDPDPETGWLTTSEGRLWLAPFRTLHNDDEGEAYAREHGEEFPFSNDYFDASARAAYPIDLTDATICTGIIRVGYREPLEDHLVPCAEMARAAAAPSVLLPVAVWRTDGEVLQLSELYRP